MTIYSSGPPVVVAVVKVIIKTAITYRAFFTIIRIIIRK
jgi:hypothetical protein